MLSPCWFLPCGNASLPWIWHSQENKLVQSSPSTWLIHFAHTCTASTQILAQIHKNALFGAWFFKPTDSASLSFTLQSPLLCRIALLNPKSSIHRRFQGYAEIAARGNPCHAEIFKWILRGCFPKVIETVKQKPPMKIKPHMFGSRQKLGPEWDEKPGQWLWLSSTLMCVNTSPPTPSTYTILITTVFLPLP